MEDSVEDRERIEDDEGGEGEGVIYLLAVIYCATHDVGRGCSATAPTSLLGYLKLSAVC